MSVSCSLAWNKTTVDSCHFKSSISYNVTEKEVTLKTLLHMQFYCPIKTGSIEKINTIPIMLFTMHSLEEIRLKFVIPRSHKGCWETMTEKETKIKDVKGASYRHAQNLFVFLCFPWKTWALFWYQQLQLHSKVARIYSPTAPMWPFWAAIMRGVFPAWSAAFTWALWLRRSWRHSTWSAKAAAWRGVLWGKLTRPQLLLNNYNIPTYLPSQEPESTRWFGCFFHET